VNVEAHIRRGSRVYNVWCAEGRTLGEFQGIVFQRQGDDYIAVENPLSRETLSICEDDPDVILVVSTVPLHLEPN
jgi:hypothetical protein